MSIKRILMLLSLLGAVFAVCIAEEGSGKDERDLPKKQEDSRSEKDDGAKVGKPTEININSKFRYK